MAWNAVSIYILAMTLNCLYRWNGVLLNEGDLSLLFLVGNVAVAWGLCGGCMANTWL